MNAARLFLLAPLALLPSQCAPRVAHAAPPEASFPQPSIDVSVSDGAASGTRAFVLKAPIREGGETQIVAQDGGAQYRLHVVLAGDKELRMKLERSDRDVARSVKVETVLPYRPGEKRVAGRVQREDGTITEVTVSAH